MTGDSRISLKGFVTANLVVRHWEEWLEEAEKRKALEARLAEILTPSVLAHLPPSMQLSGAASSVRGWVSARAAESRVFVVATAGEGEIVGLLILVQLPETAQKDALHLGYLLAESAWGRGYATELVTGLVNAKGFGTGTRFSGGVGKENIASAKVLQKSGFTRSAALSSDDTDQFIFTVL